MNIESRLQLTSETLDPVQAYIDQSMNWFARNDYTVTVGFNLNDWVEVMSNSPGVHAVTSTFNPSHSNLTPGNSFWLRLEHRGETMACIANRVFNTPNYADVMRSGKLWQDRIQSIAPPLKLVIPASTPLMSGRVGHHGGLWVHPEHRKRGLSARLPRFTRALSMRQFDVDWHCGLVLKSLGDSGLPLREYGYPNMVPCIDGLFPATGKYAQLYMTYISRSEMLDQMRDHVLGHEAKSNSESVNVPAVFPERHDNALVAAS